MRFASKIVRSNLMGKGGDRKKRLSKDIANIANGDVWPGNNSIHLLIVTLEDDLGRPTHGDILGRYKENISRASEVTRQRLMHIVAAGEVNDGQLPNSCRQDNGWVRI